MSRRLGLAVLACVLCASPTLAAPVSFTFQGVVDIVVDQNSPREILDQLPPGTDVIGTLTGVQAGDPISVTFSYDTEAGQPVPQNPSLGFYPGIANLQVTLPNLSLTSPDATINITSDLTVFANDPTRYDNIEVFETFAGSALNLPAGTTVPEFANLSIRFLTRNLSTLPDASLPSLISLDDFEEVRIGLTGFSRTSPDIYWAFSGRLVQPAVIPEPGTAALFAAGSSGLILALRRRQRRTVAKS